MQSIPLQDLHPYTYNHNSPELPPAHTDMPRVDVQPAYDADSEASSRDSRINPGVLSYSEHDASKQQPEAKRNGFKSENGLKARSVSKTDVSKSQSKDGDVKSVSGGGVSKKGESESMGRTVKVGKGEGEKGDKDKHVKQGRDCACDEESDPLSAMNICCKSCTPHHSFPCRVLFFLLLFGLDVADLISDWLLYADVSVNEKGLVYGPPDDSVIYALLAFSIIGVFTFLFESVNLWWEVFRCNPWLDADLVSAVTIWIEDLPQIAINVYIAWCREDPISVFQLSKASIVLISLLIRIIISSVKYCNKKALKEAQLKTAESKRHVAYRVFIMLGLIINSACAITVFVFTQTQKDTNGTVNFQVPTSIFEDRYNDQRYFQNVSIFVHHPDFDASMPTSATNFRANWVRFMTINDIRDQDNLDIGYNYIYEKTATDLNMALFVKEDKGGGTGTWDISECYKMDLASRAITTVSESVCRTSLFTALARSVYITFSFTPPSYIFRKLIFGDIRFNIRIFENQKCSEYDDQIGDSVSDNPAIPTIHYYRTNPNFEPSAMKHLLINGTEPRFYQNDGSDLQDITEVWKTGWGRCESSGSMAPNFQSDIPIQCSNNLP